MTSADDFIIQLMIEKGLVSSEVVEQTQETIDQQDDLSEARPDLLDKLIADGHFQKEEMTRLLAEEFDMPMVATTDLVADEEALNAVPKKLARRYGVFPLSIEGNRLRVAIHDPLDVDSVDSLSHVLQKDIETSIAAKEDIKKAIASHYGDAGVEDVMSEFEGLEGELDSVEIQGLDSDQKESTDENDAPIIRLVYLIITEAIKRRASDIHLEPLEKRFRVRYRIDGALMEVENPPKRLQLSIISRLKIMAHISIAEKRIPQDGRIQIKVAGKDLDLRVSSLPTAHGESIVMRILDKEGLKLGLPELGFFSDDQSVFERVIGLPDGIFLVTGPTGSGKTTTLYSCLHYINRPDTKIITVEDPVEYQLSGINQVQVRSEVDMSFGRALRAMLRQAPNVIMIGEIRDLETANIAINASLTGHMVFSTLHTNDAPSAVTRLIDIGVKPFLVSASLRATMAQRLVRRICPDCKQSYEPTDKDLRILGLTPEMASTGTFMKGEGCNACTGTGYRGRFGLFEIFQVDDELKEMVYNSVSTQKLRVKARELGMRTMREDGIRKVMAGLTTVDEVVRVTMGDSD
ncbi:MAG: Flp pilus assembly complex ATPase component TadA [Opitutales bacterium]|nr:Flp pilus assembly complex ATPase component TadA [Opitutales bacterium]MCH8540534.1 Flp pilus assembly complex ATPase component TadA [Opitutales bacterium]